MSAFSRDYRRNLALHAMKQRLVPISAGDLVDIMGATAQSEEHPKSCWERMDAAMVHGILKSLASAGLVRQAESKQRNPRQGRDVPMWELVDLNEIYPVPDPPAVAAGPSPPPSGPSNPYSDMSREQLMAVLWVHDELLVGVARFFREFQESTARCRRELMRVGLVDAE